jgi:hypothetical protein
MRRKAQLWRFVDSEEQPLQHRIERGALHGFIAQQQAAGADLTLTDSAGFKTQLNAVSGPATHLVLHRVREDDLPNEWSAASGGIAPLSVQIDGLAEGTHLLLLPRNLVIVMASGFSPRAPRLAAFLRARLGWDVWLHPVPRRDLGSVLEHVRRVSNIEIAINADEISGLDLGPMYEAEFDPFVPLKAAARGRQGGVIKLGWSAGQGNSANQRWFRGLLGKLAGADMTAFNTARAEVYVEGSTDKIPLDFIHDQIVTQVDVGEHEGRGRELTDEQALSGLRVARTHFSHVEKINDIVARIEGPALELPTRLIDPPPPPAPPTAEPEEDV